MLSQLSKGYGSWTAGYVDPYFGEKKAHEHELIFPEIDHESHIHGVTIGARSGRSTALSWATAKRSREPTMDGIPLPKTYTTRKGALQLYVGPDDLEDDDDDVEESEKREDEFALKPKYVEIKRPHGQELINLSLKLGTIERLAKSVLQFGDDDYDHEHRSVSDAKNKAFLKFLHDVDEGVKVTDIDSSVQPGGDLNTYLRDLKSSASNQSGNMRISKSRESLELQAILRGLDNNSNWPLSYSQDGASDRQSVGHFTRPVSRVSSRGASPGPPSTPRSTYQVLSAKKLCASIRSGSYLGRPSSRVNDEEVVESDAGVNISSATVTRPLWTPTESTDDFLIESRGSLYRGDEENDSDGGKRRGLKERSFLTNNSQLYKGRIARKGEGQRAGEVKVISKGDGDSVSQRMVQIEEELGDIAERGKQISESNLSSTGSTVSDTEKENDVDNWTERVSGTYHFSDHEEYLDDTVHETDTYGIIDVEIDEKDVEQEAVEKVEVKLNLHPGSHKSGSTKLSSRPSSHKSNSSYSGSTSTHTPSIITLQSLNSPVSQEKFRSLYKRRNTYAYVPDKGLVRSYNSQRRKSDSNEKKNGKFIDFNLHQNPQGTQGAKRYRSGANGLYPGWTPYNNNSDLSEDIYNDTDWQAADNLVQNINCTSVDDQQNQLNMQPKVEKENADIAESNQQNSKEIMETAVIDQEEYVLDYIEECNAEVKQIEEQAEGQDAIPDDDDSDLDSTMDEELIKVILSGQSDKELKAEDDLKTEETDDRFEQLQDTVKTEDNDVEEGTDEVTNAEAVKNIKEIEPVEDNEVADETSESKLSELEEEGEVNIVKRGLESTRVDDLETVRQETQDKTVDEENASDVRSNRSGRKSRSKKSKSGVSSEEDYKVEDVASVNESALPTLESDRLSEEKDGSNNEEIKILNDEQTGFSGSTDSYSDILASDKNSRPATAIQSRPASSLKLSRPTSATARPLSASENKTIQDVNFLEAYQDFMNDDTEKGDINANDTPPLVECVQDKGDKGETSEAGDSNTKEIDTVNQSHKPAKHESLAKVTDIRENDTHKQTAVEIDTKNVIPLKSHETAKAADFKPEAEKMSDIKRPRQVPKAGKNVTERKTVGKHTAQGKGVPPKLFKTTDNETEKKSSQKEVEIDKTSKRKFSAETNLGKTVVEGEGLLDSISEQTNKLDEISGDGRVVGDSSGIAEKGNTTDAHSIAAELDALGLRRKSSKGSGYALLPPGKRPKPPPEKMKIPDHIAEALNRQTDASIEYLEQDLERRGFLKDGKVTALVGESLSGPTLEAVGEGLTEEELELAKQILQQKLDEAKGTLEGKPSVTKGKGGKKPPGIKSGKKGAKKGKGKQFVEEKSPEELDREAMREKHEQEKRLREQEAAELQKKIAEKQQLLKEQNDMTSARSKELKEEMERLEREAEAIQRAEDEAREILADVRKKQREEREARRKADLERKKQEALDRREREKKEMEDKRRKEMEMMEKIADAEMRRRMREEEERRIDEEERLAQERYEAELREAHRLEEEEEERMKEMERQAEEEAMQRLIDEREAAERERRRLRQEEEALQEAEYLRRLAMEEEQRKLEERKQKMQDAEDAKREAERQRLLELRRLEEEARMTMQEEIEKRRYDALSRRDYNLESRMNIDKLRHYQGLTRAWTFSYFVHWPRETYERKLRRKLTKRDRPIGEGDPRKVVKIKNPKPKQNAEPQAETGGAPPAGIP